jgi:integrase
MSKRRGRGDDSIYWDDKRQLWVAQVSLGTDPTTGKRRRPTVHGATKQEVKDKLDQVKREASTGNARARTLTVAEYVTEWLAALELSRHARLDYEATMRNHIVPYLGTIRLQALTPADLLRWYGRLKDAGTGTAARHQAGRRFKQALRQAVRLDLIERNPADQVPGPRYQAEPVQPLTVEELPLFLAYAKFDPHFALYVTALDSGARQGELLALDWTDLRDGSIHITKQLLQMQGRKHQEVARVKTRASNRHVLLSPPTLAVLEKHRLEQERRLGSCRHMFPDSKGRYEHGQDLLRHFRTVLNMAGLQESTRFHDLRHTCASLLLQAGVNVKVVSERLGHGSVRITLERYAHVMPTMQEAATGTMGGILGAALPGGPIGSKSAANPAVNGQCCDPIPFPFCG